MSVDEHREEAIVGYYRVLSQVNVGFTRVRLKGLDPDRLYTVSWEVCGERKVYEAYGDELMSVGIPVNRADLSAEGGDFAALLYEIKG